MCLGLVILCFGLQSFRRERPKEENPKGGNMAKIAENQEILDRSGKNDQEKPKREIPIRKNRTGKTDQEIPIRGKRSGQTDQKKTIGGKYRKPTKRLSGQPQRYEKNDQEKPKRKQL